MATGSIPQPAITSKNPNDVRREAARRNHSEFNTIKPCCVVCKKRLSFKKRNRRTCSARCAKEFFRRNQNATRKSLAHTRLNRQTTLKRSIQSALRLLQVRFKTSKEFWRANESRLYAIYDEAKTSYRQLAKSVHTDVGGDNDQMVNLNTAWENIEQQFKQRLRL